MRNGQKRMRGRGGQHRKSQNPLTRVYELNGPDVKIRGTASHIAEKYIQLARDSQSSGDPVAAENYYQHAEHYFRLIAAAQEQFRQQNPYYQQQPQQQQAAGGQQGGEESYDDDGDEGQPFMGQNEPSLVQQPQPYLPRDAQPFPPRDQAQQGRPQQACSRRSPSKAGNPDKRSAACRPSSPAAVSRRSRIQAATATTRATATRTATATIAGGGAIAAAAASGRSVRISAAAIRKALDPKAQARKAKAATSRNSPASKLHQLTSERAVLRPR